MSLAAFRFRAGVPDDAPELLRAMEIAFDGYRSFAPRGWEPPGEEEEHLRERLAHPEVWCRVAERGDALAGHVALMPAAIHARAVDDPELGHLWQLFVQEEHWGTGLATALHGAAVEEAAERGFTALRLFTPALQARARRFYEREGWRTEVDAFFEPNLGLHLVELRRPLSANRPPASSADTSAPGPGPPS